MATARDVRRYLRNRQDEIDSAAQYVAMAEGEADPSIAQIYRDLAAIEERHAAFWERELEKAGHDDVGPRRPSRRARVLAALARKLGAGSILSTVAAREVAGRDAYSRQIESAGTRMSKDERTHARVLGTLVARRGGISGSALARVEGRHRSFGGNALRAAVLGANDGLCSNLSLVMGAFGVQASSRVVLVTGIAGLLAGALSMALGEWVSVTSARELAENEIQKESEELELAPEDEREELELIYRAKGVTREQAQELSLQLMSDKESALGVLAREELGIDPEELGGSASVAAATSFALFAIGAVIPVVPFAVTSAPRAAALSLAASGVALAAIGAGITLFTGKSVLRSALRQLLLGYLAAGATYGIGRLLGVALAG
jgi:VIT1/CCC1 family predicted Fe2+/Mn2+ transporter